MSSTTSTAHRQDFCRALYLQPSNQKKLHLTILIIDTNGGYLLPLTKSPDNEQYHNLSFLMASCIGMSRSLSYIYIYFYLILMLGLIYNIDYFFFHFVIYFLKVFFINIIIIFVNNFCCFTNHPQPLPHLTH